MEKKSSLFRALFAAALFLFLAEQGYAQRIMSAHKQKMFMRALPKRVDSHEVIRIIRDKDTIWYTKQEMPSIHQNWETNSAGGIVLSDYNIAGKLDQFGNANREFPWANPGGTDQDKNVVSVTLINLPKGNPVVWYTRNNHPMTYWIFPVGTVFAEILYLEHEGDLHCFEIRTRTREPDDWGVDILRPFPTQKKLIGTLVKNDKVQEALFLAKSPVETIRLRSNHNRPFSVEASRQILPELPSSLVAKLLLETTFESALATDWADNAQGITAQNGSLGLVPVGYTGAHLGNDRNGCSNCHKDVAANARDFQKNREWYGTVRGSDGIFSWHPFEPRAASRNGSRRDVVLRKEFTENGIVEKYDHKKHRSKLYHLSKFSG